MNQTQEEYDNISVFEDYDIEDDPFTLVKKRAHAIIPLQFTHIVYFDDNDDYLSPELYSILFKYTSPAYLNFNLSMVLVIYPGILLT